MKMIFLEKLKKIPFNFWILLAIILLGIFLRTYNFHDWLHFGSDQSRDAMIAQHVLNGEKSWPKLGPEAANTGFHLGPIYYYFQIITARVFGTSPDVFAYPDLFFSILSIPLMYLLLKKYFTISLSLSLTGIYAVSFYAIQYSRFAWNTNSIPFFSVLFVLALVEYLFKNEKTSWLWIVLLGIATGVGMQLHTITLLLFPMMLFFAAIFSIKNNFRVWTRWLIIFVIILVLNGGQISHEINTNYSNTRSFFATSTDKSQSAKESFIKSLKIDWLCHAQANAVIISSLGDRDKCSYDTVLNESVSRKIKNDIGITGYGLYLAEIILIIFFSIFGYTMLVKNFYIEKDQSKKYFLGVILLYVSLSFLLLFSVLRDSPLRYFIHTTFVPLLFVGFMMEAIQTKITKNYSIVVLAVTVFLVSSNLYFVSAEALKLATNTRGDSGYAVLGQMELLIEFMKEQSDGQTAYLFGRNFYFSTYASPLIYVADQKNFDLIRRRKNIDNVPIGAPVFYIWKNSDPRSKKELSGREIETARVVGSLGIYKLKN